MKPGPKEQRLAELRTRSLEPVSDEEVAKAAEDTALVGKALRAFLKHRAQARDRMKRLRQKGKKDA